MSKAIILVGALIILHTLIAKLTGIPEISDYLPVTWFGGNAENSEFYKVVEGQGKSYSSVYTVGAGSMLVVLGLLVHYLGKKDSA